MPEPYFYLWCKRCGGRLILPDSTLLEPNARYRRLASENWAALLLCADCKRGFRATFSDVLQFNPQTGSGNRWNTDFSFYKVSLKCPVDRCVSICDVIVSSRKSLTDWSAAELVWKGLGDFRCSSDHQMTRESKRLTTEEVFVLF